VFKKSAALSSAFRKALLERFEGTLQDLDFLFPQGRSSTCMAIFSIISRGAPLFQNGLQQAGVQLPRTGGQFSVTSASSRVRGPVASYHASSREWSR